MKTKKIFLSLLGLLFAGGTYAQDKTTVTANSNEISDNLDLRAIASLFGESQDLADFENRLNDPKNQISNLDLNNDNQVDYLRVIETVEENAHIVVLQSILGKDLYQDIATIEVEKDQNNKIQIQVVGDTFIYGNNYIYEPVYVSTPIICNFFWRSQYRPYYSTWYWGYYPPHYRYWRPFPVYTYRRHIGLHININFHYNYVNHRRCQIAYNRYATRRANYYETRYPERSFSYRNNNVVNRYELDRTRGNYNSVEPRNNRSRETIQTNSNVPSRRENASPRSSQPRATIANPRSSSTSAQPSQTRNRTEQRTSRSEQRSQSSGRGQNSRESRQR